MLLLFVVLLVFLLEPVAAASSIMDHALPGAPMEPFFADVEDILNPLCQCCALPFYQCMQAMVGTRLLYAWILALTILATSAVCRRTNALQRAASLLLSPPRCPRPGGRPRAHLCLRRRSL